MKVLSTVFAFVSLAASAAPISDPVFWPATTYGHNESAACVTSEDPFDIPAYIFGEQAKRPPNMLHLKFPNTENPSDNGKCIDRSRYRPVIKLSPAGQEAYGQVEDSDHLVVANVRHFNNFYVARIPVTKIVQMNFLVAIGKMPVLGTRGNHAEMRVFFSEPVKLVAQWPLNSAESLYVNELIFTGNPAGVDQAGRRDPMKNFDGSLLHARGIHTVETRLKDTFVDAHADTEKQFRMAMTARESEAYARLYIRLADTQRFGRHFLLTSLNCNFTQFEILDKVFSARYTPTHAPFDPESAEKNLLARGLINRTVTLLPFEKEEFSKKFLARQ
jgi:hypothetical protein